MQPGDSSSEHLASTAGVASLSLSGAKRRMGLGDGDSVLAADANGRQGIADASVAKLSEPMGVCLLESVERRPS